MFIQKALLQSAPVYDAIVSHDFIWQLIEGNLDQRIFIRYVQQDALYLADYAKALAILAGKAPDQDTLMRMLKFSEGCIVVERSLHEHFLARHRAEPALEKSPACFAYTNFLLATVALEPFCVGLAAVLPCFKIYTDVGHYIHRRATNPNPYRAWIDTYSSREFDSLTESACHLADHEFGQAGPEDRKKMMKAFCSGVRMEYGFWDDAYRMTEWVGMEERQGI
jgi:thiaminase/transcriptional activator TenA